MEKYVYTERIKVWKPFTLKDGGTEQRAVWIPSGRVYLPEVEAVLPTDDKQHPNSIFIEDRRGLWDNKVHAYWNELVEYYDELFAELNCLIDRNNYFKQGIGWGIEEDDEE